jgi:catabolite repression HPr-like protein
MKQKSIIIKYSHGIHLRPAADLVKIAGTFKCEIFIENDGNKVNAKSILGLLTLAATYGSEITIYCSGPDEEKALDHLVSFISRLPESLLENK